MCGLIAGLAHRPIERKQIDRALATLAHRGPDGSGTWSSHDERMMLGHTRLSIVGLTNGAQPMSNQAGTIHAVVNGEFYGYQSIRDELRAAGHVFATESDSEIALHLYADRGMRTMESLRGEFAMVIADQRRRSLFAIRDRFGIKPLYYAVTNGNVFFASEAKALFALGVPAAWDAEAAYHDGFQFRSHERTIFAGIRAVPPGCYAIAENGRVTIYPYWDWAHPTAEETAKDDRTEADVIDGFRETLADAIDERLVADVDVGCYLSGGVDSCAVLGMAQARASRPLHAFTLSFAGTRYDEAERARQQAESVGARHTVVTVSQSDIADAYMDAVRHAETPMANGHGVAKYLLSRAVRAAGVKAVLTGEGADEMLAGYKPLFDDPGYDMTSTPEPWPATFSEAGQRLGWLPTFMTRFGMLGIGLIPLYRRSHMNELRKRDPYAAVLDRLALSEAVTGRDRVNQALYLLAKTNLPNLILTILGDRMEMAHSVEGRLPFLDHRVADYAAHIPPHLKTKGAISKGVLREAARPWIANSAFNAEKQPFLAPPTSDDKAMIAFYRDVLHSRALEDQPLFEPLRARALLERLIANPDDRAYQVEGLVQRVVSTALLHRQFKMSADIAL